MEKHKIYKLNNSGVRSDKLNESLNGSTTSQHSHCEAADIKQ
ncbi:D-Ala-D-Ala carboxypeptidase family metallohydrolase [Helicobacter bilis]